MSQAANGKPQSEDRHVLVLITGGTICMQDSSNGLVPTKGFANNLLVPDGDFHDGSDVDTISAVNETGKHGTAVTIRPPPKGRSTPRYRCSILEFEELIDSSSMDGNHWNNIVTTLRRNWHMFSAFVILHGTDTLAYTASALSFMLGRPDKTVIVTGSQVSMYYPRNDGHDNLLDSLTLAATYNVPEVSVVFHHHLYRATRVTKVSAFSLAAFTTPNAKPLATIRKGANKAWTAFLSSRAIKLASENITIEPKSEVDITNWICPTSSLDTARVAVLKVYPGISSDLISHIIQIPNLGGLVLETFGAGNVPLGSGDKSLLQILSAAVDKGIVVVSVTQCLTGSVTSAYESARKMERNGIVTGLDMTTEAAYTKLVYLLSLPVLSHFEVAGKMRENLRGELTADFREEQRSRDSVLSSTIANETTQGP